MQVETAGSSPIAVSVPRRLGVYLCVAASAAFVVVDAIGVGESRNRFDLTIELVARALLLVLAVLASNRTQGDRHLKLLLWGVICISLDTYWQNTYRHFGGKPLEWTEMVVKYVAVGIGLGLLLRLCASFGDAPADRLRASLRSWSLPLGGVLSLIGLWHGVVYIQSCYFFVHGTDQCIIGDDGVFALDVYLLGNAMLRVAVVVAALIGYLRSSPEYRQRTLLVAFASVIFALGTVIHFVARLNVPYDVVVVLQIVDSVTTLLFPLGLLYAATRRRLFDVEYLVKRSVSYTLASLIVAGLLFAVELFLHEKLAALLRIGKDSPLQYAVGIPFLLLWRPLEHRIAKRVDHLILPEREKRRDRLRAVISRIPFVDSLVELEQMLHHALGHAVAATFADIFVHDGKGGYGAFLSSRDPQPSYLPEKQPPLPLLAHRKHLCLGCNHQDIPDAELAVMMPVGGKPFGILLCGRPDRIEVEHFAADEIAEISMFATMAASALFAHGVKLERPFKQKESS
jgi:uncharacterized membrane protein